ncbi:S41 family peptidase [Ferrimonas futtsuensis]|uniref:S41 family peptidase n=1 Tax=Ferrimonas futtsuensis TaxID=364764 RepID=UPI00040C60E2|nr:S41 family peptidase [Ferrimonas futtsuensis]
MKYLLLATTLATCSLAQATTVQQQCLTDLASLPDFLLTNDTGAPDHLARHGQSHFDQAMNNAKNSIAEIQTEAECDALIKGYLKAWRPGHLNIRPLNREASDKASNTTSKSPQVKRLSATTLYWSVPSFGYAQGKALEALIKEHAPKLEGVENWIVDVRGNGGGNDDSYNALLPYLLSGETTEVSLEFLSTPVNIEAMETLCQRFMDNDPGCVTMVKPMIARLKGVPSGEYVQLGDESISYQAAPERPDHAPSKVAVLVDGGCASSCEQFLLRVKQSFKVKLVGRSSYGALDYSNIRPHALPSGKRELFYATSRSLRLPYQPVDIAGIAPDIYLPKPKDDQDKDAEVIQVQRWLEGGSLRPGAK